MATNAATTPEEGPVVVGAMEPRPFRVDRVSKETHDTFTMELLPAGADEDFSYRPGQFNMLYVFGVGEAPISISGDAARTPRLVHTTRIVGTVTRALSRLKADDLVGVRGPFGAGWPVDQAEGQDVVILAGGIGLAPLRSALYHILNNRRKYGKVLLLYGTRTPEDILYRKELEQWRARFDLYVDVTVDRATENWRGNVGVVTALVSKVRFDPLNSLAFVCGPEVMMRFGAVGLIKCGVPVHNIYLSMERNMKCGVGLCGHCQMGPHFICKDGPVFHFDRVKDLMLTREI
jgi:NAD(P)H-flavin reductase